MECKCNYSSVVQSHVCIFNRLNKDEVLLVLL